mgnify:CR=1 FL=1
MPTIRINKKAIDALPQPSGTPVIYWDSELRGFGVRVTKKGVKSFVLDCRFEDESGAKRRKRVVIGRFGPVTVHQARNEALKLLGDLAREFPDTAVHLDPFV